jgi:Ca2+-binding RTX toxin-like protein
MASGVTVNFASSSATGGGGNDTITGFENLIGSAFDDSLTGNAVANLIEGGNGNDALNGGSGNDTLLGGAGQDSLIGGSGSDIFSFGTLADMGLTALTWDTISDFSSIDGDRIDLAALDADVSLFGNQAFSYIGAAAFTAVGQVRYDTTTGVLYGSNDADSDAEFAIQLVGVAGLSSSDFVL